MKHITQKIVLALVSFLSASVAFAQTAETAASSGGAGLIGLAAGLAIGLAAMGAAYGQSKAASAALEGIARNPAAQPKIFTSMMIALILIETMAIYAFVISFLLIGKI